MYSHLQKDASNAVVHYDEAKQYFPKEFQMLFGKAQVPVKKGKGGKSRAARRKNLQLNESFNFQMDTQSNNNMVANGG